MGRRITKILSKFVGKEIATELNNVGAELGYLTVDVAASGTRVLGGTAKGLRTAITSINKENLRNVVTYSCDVVVGNEIGTTNAKLDKAIANGEFGKEIAEYVLDTVHGDAAYRKEARKIEEKIAKAESELDKLLLKADLAQLELEATKEIAKLTAQTEALA